ncbi:NAD(P)-dependent oxidoreductase [Tropicimonas sp. IMCC6043]|uniref:NAD(P)-dependent oxidoreductase n=1 Tax=Tropicimonas sp. IMCC6043 TaxID=2510645 RepID=UPI00101D3825|nr:NAD(P)-binding domain-containing protein [Tropicimonas sp. IMCC6043]RYH06394.1 NAD(P)-dependent oxidoreductase [Tropicimonas sp. IMCC6043]
MQSVSVIGLGAMGTALARELLDNGYRLTVWNRTADKAARLVEAGATLAASPSEAIRASDVTITCIRSHGDTRALLGAEPAALSGKTIIELSTGESAEANSLMDWIHARGADCLIGMISVFPKDIGSADSAILVVGREETWARCSEILTTLGGASARIGEDPIALAAIYASLVLPRQGFMFGMIYGAILCEKAGISMKDYVEVLPLTIRIVHDYFDLFAATVPDGNFADPPASLGVYHAAFEDVLGTCRALGAPDELPRLLRDLLQRGMDAGLGDQQVTALTRLLAKLDVS